MENIVPTRDWLSRRSLADNAACPWGCPEIEDRSHISLRCEKVRAVLKILRGWGFAMPNHDYFADLCAWILKATEGTEALARLFCGVVYQCWRARNDHTHNRVAGSATSIAATVLGNFSRAEAFTFSDHWSTNQPHRLSSILHWCPPPPKWLKVNVDGALLPNNRAGIGVVVRDETGQLVSVLGHSMEHWDSGQVELLAISCIYQVVRPFMNEMEGFILECDNVNVINFVQRQYRRQSWELKEHVEVDLNFLFEFKNLLFTHVTRRCNRVADFCANYALQHRSFWQFFDHDLEGLSLLVREDLDHFVPT